jgi:hypothetical protein
MVPLSVPEVRRLFYYLVGRRPLSALHRLAWSGLRDGRIKLSRAFATTNAIWLLSLSYNCSIGHFGGILPACIDP